MFVLFLLLEDPRKMMDSMKNLPRKKGGDGDYRQYHPLAYSLYWKMAQDKVSDFIQGGRAEVKIVKFEDLVTNPNEIGQDLAEFLQTKLSNTVVKNKKNSSFQGQQKLEFTPTEKWICELINRKYLRQLGYELENVSPRVGDIREIINLSFQFAFYQIQRAFLNQRKRASIKNYIFRLLS